MEYMESKMQEQYDAQNELIKEISRLQDLLTKHGICEDCGELYNHDFEEPFASCGCKQSEWYELTPHMLQVHGLKTERDTLLAKVEMLIDAGNEVYAELQQWALCESHEETEIAYKAWLAARSKTPQQCLRDVQAEAGRKGFIACLNFACHTPENWISLADEYATKVRNGGQ